MGPDKWEATSMENSMFNFKEGLKRKMLKVKYFKHPDIAHYLYDRYLAAYGRLPWNNEVPLYFAKLFYVEFFLGMKPNYNDLPSELFGPRKGQLCDCMGTKHDTQLPRLEPPLVPQPPCEENLRSEKDATSQISREERDDIIDNFQIGLGGIDIVLN